MADQQAWTIGAAPECDIILDHPTVSGRHCRITRSGDAYRLEDLDSTNGTFVNGARVTAPLEVTAADEVKLGPQTVLPWEKIEPAAAGRRIIRIGRSPDNDVVLDYPNVSGSHARIVVADGAATIEDLGSTNGVAINDPDNLVNSAELSEGDTVHFGATSVAAADLLHPERASPRVAAPPTPSRAVTAAKELLNSPRSLAIGAAGLVVLAVALAAAARLLDSGGTPAESGESSPQQSSPLVANSSSDSTDVKRPDAPATAVADDPRDAVYSVLVQSKGVDQLIHVGTAWAAGPHQLVTSAVVAEYLESHAAGDLSAVQVRCASQQKDLVVTGWTVHPEYVKAKSTGQAPFEKQQQLHKKLDELKEAEAPPDEKELAALEEQLAEADWQLFLAGERMVFFAVGLLTVEETLPFRLELRPSGRKLAIESPAVTYGVPFDPEAMVSRGPREPSKLTGRVKNVVRPPEESSGAVRRLLVTAPPEHMELDWQGGPVLDAKGRVLGVYARPSPPVDPKKPLTGKTFDAVLIDQVRELPIGNLSAE